MTNYTLNDWPHIPWTFVFLASMWQLWKARNNSVFDNEDTSFELLSTITIRVASELCDAFQIHRENDTNQQVDWKPPHKGWLKLNVDDCVKGPMDKASIGGVLHDSNENWIWGFAVRIGRWS